MDSKHVVKQGSMGHCNFQDPSPAAPVSPVGASLSRKGQLIISRYSSRSAIRSVGTRPSATADSAAAISSRDTPLLSCRQGGIVVGGTAQLAHACRSL